MMTDFIEYLKKFNRKERFFLLDTVFGNEGFKLSQPFRERLDNLFGLQIPDQVFCAMDYHIDWLYACLHLAFTPTVTPIQIHPNQGLIKGNQEDIDLLIAYCQDQIFHLIMLEAKGVTGWSSSQIKSKLDRLRQLFPDPEDLGARRVHPHFALMSPNESKKIKYSNWPKWAIDSEKQRPYWIKLDLPSELYYPSRCEEDGAPSSTGSHWKVICVQYK